MDLRTEFDRAWPWLAAAIKHGRQIEVQPGPVLALVLSNQATLWPGERAAMVTQLLSSAEGRFLHVWLAGGSLAELLAMRAGIEAWGRVQGAEFMSIDGRRGWDRLLRPFGYERVGAEVVKRL